MSQCRNISRESYKNTPTKPLHFCTKTVWRKSPSPPPCWHLTGIVPWRDQRKPASHRKHTVLCTCRWHHCPYGIELNCNWTVQGHNKHNGESKSATQLSCNLPQCQYILSLWHDHERPLWCILSIGVGNFKAEHVGISLWDGPPLMVTPYKWMMPFLPFAQSYNLLSRQLWKPSSAPSS